MPESLIGLWSSGSIPWVEIILVLVVINVLLLSGGGRKKRLIRWWTKISTGKPKKNGTTKAKVPTASVITKRKRSSKNKGWDLAEVNGAGLKGVSSKRKRTAQIQQKGWDISAPAAAPAFKVNSKRKRSSDSKGWSASEISEKRSSFSVSELRKQSSQRMNKEWSLEVVAANDVRRAVKPSQPAAAAQAAPRVRIANIKFVPADSISLNSPMRKKGSPIRIGRSSRSR